MEPRRLRIREHSDVAAPLQQKPSGPAHTPPGGSLRFASSGSHYGVLRGTVPDPNVPGQGVGGPVRKCLHRDGLGRKLDMFIHKSSMFSQTAEYALRALTFLAQNYPAPQTTAKIAEGTQVPAGYLAKVLQQLGKANLLHAARGKHGGWEMAKSPAFISILDIVNVVDPIRRIDACPLRLATHNIMLCPLHKKMDQALEQIERTLASSTLAELLATPGMPVPLCNAMVEVRQ